MARNACFKIELLPGGFAEGISTDELVEMIKNNAKDVDGMEQIKMGVAVEMEHTRDPKVAEEIARDHLVEFPDYYTYLKKMEVELEKKWKGKWDARLM